MHGADEIRPPHGDIVSLRDAERVTQGGENELFLRPGKRSQLIKVLRPNVVARFERSRRLKSRIRRRLGIGPHKNLLRFYSAYIDAMVRAQDIGRMPPLPHPRAIMLTDRGLGLAVQMIRDAEGRMAPSLHDLAEAGRLDDALIDKLNAFVADLYRFNVVCTDLVPRNIVYEGRHGRDRFVLVDGFGARNVLPIRRWSHRLNARALDAACLALARRIGLDWDGAARRIQR